LEGLGAEDRLSADVSVVVVASFSPFVFTDELTSVLWAP
jgi:hypothetical protein